MDVTDGIVGLKTRVDEPRLPTPVVVDPALIRRALDEDRIVVLFQPIVRIADGGLVSVEALARISCADGTLLPPSRFIPPAEQSGLIVPLGLRVLDRACEALRRWQRADAGAGLAGLMSVSVNLSAVQARDPGLPNTIRSVLDRIGLPPDRLMLELTETAMFAGDENSRRALSALADDGVRLALDDFGTGWSSFQALARLPLSALKIDRGLVAEMATDPARSGAIVQTIISLAHTLDLAVVAEGVEAPVQQLILRAYRCDHMQGYLVGRPMEDAGILALLRSRRVSA